MASYLYGIARGKFLGHATAALNWITQDIKACLVDGADYTPSQNTHDFLDDIAGAGIVATSSNFASKTATLGAADAADITFTSVTGDSVEYIIPYHDTTVDSTSEIIAKIDDYTGLPVTPNGGNITVAWPSGGIFIL
jgi:hypothetical protein